MSSQADPGNHSAAGKRDSQSGEDHQRTDEELHRMGRRKKEAGPEYPSFRKQFKEHGTPAEMHNFLKK